MQPLKPKAATSTIRPVVPWNKGAFVGPKPPLKPKQVWSIKDWLLPSAMERIRRKLAGSADGDRQMVTILAAVLSDGLAAVEAACAEALREATHSADVVINILARHREPAPPVTILTPDALRLTHAPAADCARYDTLRRPI